MSRRISATFAECRSAVPSCLSAAPHMSEETAWLLASHLAILVGSTSGQVQRELEGICDALADELDDMDAGSRSSLEKSGPVPKARPASDSVHDRTLAELMAGAGGATR